MSHGQASRLVNRPRGTQRYLPARREDEDGLTEAILELASQYGCYGCCRITRRSSGTDSGFARTGVERCLAT
jgi:putative transposase